VRKATAFNFEKRAATIMAGITRSITAANSGVELVRTPNLRPSGGKLSVEELARQCGLKMVDGKIQS
jgi:hypothetical protein